MKRESWLSPLPTLGSDQKLPLKFSRPWTRDEEQTSKKYKQPTLIFPKLKNKTFCSMGAFSGFNT
jgi:hypothetical protein